MTGGLGGVNGSDTFNWGGYSVVNAMSDGSSLYVVGSYNVLHDTFYTVNAGGVMGRATNIAAQLGVQRADVPEPASIALFGLGLAALAMLRRRKFQA